MTACGFLLFFGTVKRFLAAKIRVLRFLFSQQFPNIFTKFSSFPVDLRHWN